MSLIGTLEQYRLSHVLQRVEAHEKTGLLVVKQGQYWIEFYFRDGRLLCIGPVRTRATLGERLAQDGLISSRALLDIRLSLGDAEQSETRVALALMEGGHVSREDLRAWAIQKTGEALGAILTWVSGEIYFEEGTPPPTDRLLVSMSVTSILETIPQPSSSAQSASPSQSVQSSRPVQETYNTLPFDAAATASNRLPSPHLAAASSNLVTAKSSPMIERVPTLMGATQFMGETGVNSSDELANKQQKNEGSANFLNDTADSFLNKTGSADGFLNDAQPTSDVHKMNAGGLLSAASLIENFPADALPATESLSPLFSAPNTEDFSPSAQSGSEVSFAGLTSPDTPPPMSSSVVAVPVMHPVPPKRIDTSFMQPDMVLCLVDLSPFREQNPQVQITPDQWRLLLCADGHTSLQAACQALALPPDVVCRLAGELLAEGLIQVTSPQQLPPSEISPVSQELAASGLGNGYIAPGYAAAPASPWSASVPVLPTSDVAPSYTAALPFETESQWGNGGNGATFVPGRGWVTTPQPLQPLQPVEQVPVAPSPHLAYAYAGNGSHQA